MPPVCDHPCVERRTAGRAARRTGRACVVLCMVAAAASACGIGGRAARMTEQPGFGMPILDEEQARQALLSPANLGPNWSEDTAGNRQFQGGCMAGIDDPLDALKPQEYRVDFRHADDWPFVSSAVWPGQAEGAVEAAFAEVTAALRGCTEVDIDYDGSRYELEVWTAEPLAGLDADDQVGYEAYGKVTWQGKAYEAYFRGTFARHGAAAMAVFTDDQVDSHLHDRLARLGSERLAAVLDGEAPPVEQADPNGNV